MDIEGGESRFKSSPLFSLNWTPERFQNVVVICHICYFYALFSCQVFHKRCYITASYRIIQHVSTIRSPREHFSNNPAQVFYLSAHLLALPTWESKMGCDCGFSFLLQTLLSFTDGQVHLWSVLHGSLLYLHLKNKHILLESCALCNRTRRDLSPGYM